MIVSPSKRFPLSANVKTRISNRRSGTTTVEFAITCGIVFMFFFASLEFSRVTMYRHTVENALYEGARAGIMPGATSQQVHDSTVAILQRSGIHHAIVDVTPTEITNSTPYLQVRIQMALDRGLYAPAFYFIGKTLDRSIEMRREGIE